LDLLKKKLEDLRQLQDAGSVDSTLCHLREMLARPVPLFDAHATMAALENLVDVATEKASAQASRSPSRILTNFALITKARNISSLIGAIGKENPLAGSGHYPLSRWSRTVAHSPPLTCSGFATQIRSLPETSVLVFHSGVRERSVLENYPKKEEILSYITDGVNVFHFFAPFKGSFQGKKYCSNIPHEAIFPNAASCGPFSDFISKTIMDRVINGSLHIVGKVGSCHPPHLVLPITIEPCKPRMCHDERVLNCWIKDCPFSLDYLTDLIRYVGPNHFQTSFDDKSGYDHVRLHPSSSTFCGLEWQGWYFTYTSLPFGWKASAFIYHNIGLAATNRIRSLGVPCSQYIDDRHVGQLRLPCNHSEPAFATSQLAHMAAFITCSTLISLGYFISLKKSVFEPTMSIRFLGYVCDSQLQAFILPQDKRDNFATLRETILKNKSISLKNLQKFAGKTTSFSLLVPAAKLYTNTAYQAISKAVRAGSAKIHLSDQLRQEISHWRFLEV
ncbi:hypothetical protein QZH41_013487, partial [Actinostola sp. cb2023]